MKKDNCAHFNGFQNGKCEAGVCYLELAGGKRDGIALRLPCCAALAAETERMKALGLTPIECPSYRKKTAEEIAEEEADIRRLVDRMKKTGPWASNLKAEHKKGGHGVSTCPICSAPIHWAISSYNGHMRARCETPNCINFIE